MTPRTERSPFDERPAGGAPGLERPGDETVLRFAREVFGVEPRDVVLASRSPRRLDLLTRLGVAPEVVPPDVDERRRPGEDAIAHVERLALEKSRAVATRYRERLVIAADTTVTLDGVLLGKPSGAEEAGEMLRRLSGRTHRVVTGVAVARNGARLVASETTHVTIRKLGNAEISAYVSSGEPLDKAGAYGAQALGSAFVSRIEGCYYNVVGLPIARLVALVRELGG